MNVKKEFKKRNLFLAMLFLMAITVNAQEQKQVGKRVNIALEHGSHRLGKRTDAMMQQWRDYGLGQFIHWGIYSITGGNWNGEFYPGASEFIRTWNKMPTEVYDNLYKKFNPKNFDPKVWAKQAKNMGAKYMIITTKHHDGFCLWPSKFTDYTIANTPYKKDIIGDIVNAYEAEGIDVYLYFSVMDWNHPGYRAEIKTKEDEVAYEDFKAFTRNQLLELIERYPSAKGLWFDGTWDAAWKKQAKFADDLEKEIKSKIPAIVIGSRFRPDDFGNRHFDANGNMIGDYEQGWERKLPEKIEDINGNDWDCVMTIPENQWGYHADWRGHVKTSYELIELLVKSVSLDGNFVLNFGPESDGKIRPEENKIAKEIGDWMDVNKEAIQKCGYLNWKKQDWGYYTTNRSNGKKYMIVFNQPFSNELKIQTPEKVYLNSAYFIDNPGQSLSIEKTIKSSYLVKVPTRKSSTYPYVIVLDSSSEKVEDDPLYIKPKI